MDEEVRCPRCSTPNLNRSDRQRCWACGYPLGATTTVDIPRADGRQIQEPTVRSELPRVPGQTEEVPGSDLASVASWLALAAGATAAIAAFTPWITAAKNSYTQDSTGNSYTSTTSVSWSGFDPQVLDGWYAVMLGCALVLVPLLAWTRRKEGRVGLGMAEIVLGAGLLAVSARDIAAVNATAMALKSSGFSWLASYVSVSTGAGLWLVAVAGAVAVLAGAWHVGGSP